MLSFASKFEQNILKSRPINHKTRSPSSTSVQSGAFAAIYGDTITMFVPSDEVGTVGGWRATSFIHDGAFGPADRAGDVVGGNPTEDLLPLTPPQ